MDPIQPELVFKDYYSCITYGYKFSDQMIQRMEKEEVNTNKTYFKFTCIDPTQGV